MYAEYAVLIIMHSACMHTCILDLENNFCLQLLHVNLHMLPLVDVCLAKEKFFFTVVLKTKRQYTAAPAVLTVSHQMIILAVKTLDAYVRTVHNNNYIRQLLRVSSWCYLSFYMSF